jgi:hypothetical protein
VERHRFKSGLEVCRQTEVQDARGGMRREGPRLFLFQPLKTLHMSPSGPEQEESEDRKKFTG